MSEPDVDEIDKQELKEELSQIKEAMGIEEMYPGQRRMWLIHGAIIGLAGILTNLSFAVGNLPEYLYIVIWYSFIAVALVVQWRFAVSNEVKDGRMNPSWRVLFVGLIAGWFVSTGVLGAVVRETELEGVVQGAVFFGITVAFIGMGYLLIGNTLKAYKIRKRDRYPFYIGGAWMLALSIFIPYFEILQYWGYALFGLVFFVHGLASYYYLREPVSEEPGGEKSENEGPGEK